MNTRTNNGSWISLETEPVPCKHLKHDGTTALKPVFSFLFNEFECSLCGEQFEQLDLNYKPVDS